MKKRLIPATLAALILITPATSFAHSYDSDDDGNFWRYAAYILHPVGQAIEHFILRPFHKNVLSDPGWAYWLGHDPHESDEM